MHSRCRLSLGSPSIGQYFFDFWSGLFVPLLLEGLVLPTPRVEEGILRETTKQRRVVLYDPGDY